jgi:subtilisin-like proprotein convertase family protein
MRTLLLFLLCLAGHAPAAVISLTDSAVTLIPDGDSSGVARSLTVSGATEPILGVEVDISLSAASTFNSFLGDFYIYLQHDSDLAVLVNRPGRRAGAPGGYADNQSMGVTFTMLGTNDIHDYRLAVTGSHTVALSGPLAGSWQPDGRAVDPATVLDTSPRTAGLDVFAGDPADGTWRLFVADMSNGAVHQLNAWTLRVTTIPEPGSAALLFAALASAAGLRRRR